MPVLLPEAGTCCNSQKYAIYMGRSSFPWAGIKPPIAIVLVAALLALGGAYTTAWSEPKVTARREAWAQWEQPNTSRGVKVDWRYRHYRNEKVDFWSYRVWVIQSTPMSSLEMKTHVVLDRSACVQEDKRSSYCQPVRSVKKLIPNDTFQFDDTLETAAVTFHAFGLTHSATWKGESNRGRAISEGKCEDGPHVGDKGQGLNRYATATGTVFGKRMKNSDSQGLTSLKISAFVETC